jgi:hypothetical protein
MKSISMPRRFFPLLALAGLLALQLGCGSEEAPPKPQAQAQVDKGPVKSEQDTQEARRISSNNLKQISLSIHNYATTHRAFPPAYVADKNGKPLLSWRVLILPYLDQENMYRQFHLDEPWNSEHNKALLANMPIVYRTPGSQVTDQFKTNYLSVRGKNTVFSGKRPCNIASIRDGTSNTVMTVEVSDARAVEWTRPDDFEYDPQNPGEGLIGLRDNGFFVGVADGSVRFIRSPKSPEVLNAWFDKNDRKPIQIEE